METEIADIDQVPKESAKHRFRWYVKMRNKPLYLHKDGTWHYATYVTSTLGAKTFNGLFESRETATECFVHFYPSWFYCLVA